MPNEPNAKPSVYGVNFCYFYLRANASLKANGAETSLSWGRVRETREFRAPASIVGAANHGTLACRAMSHSCLFSRTIRLRMCGVCHRFKSAIKDFIRLA